MMPAPSHLKDCVVPHKGKRSSFSFAGKVQCTCGGKKFQLLFPGQTHDYEGKAIPCTAEIKGKYFFLIKAKCAKCEKEHLLLDEDFHGWNGFVCHKPEQAKLPRPGLVPWKCLRCGKVEHTAEIEVFSEGKEDFIDETDGEFDEDRWPDGFGSLVIDIKCSSCRLVSTGWVACETM